MKENFSRFLSGSFTKTSAFCLKKRAKNLAEFFGIFIDKEDTGKDAFKSVMGTKKATEPQANDQSERAAAGILNKKKTTFVDANGCIILPSRLLCVNLQAKHSTEKQWKNRKRTNS